MWWIDYVLTQAQMFIGLISRMAFSKRDAISMDTNMAHLFNQEIWARRKMCIDENYAGNPRDCAAE